MSSAQVASKVYLTVTGQPQSRDTLATLLWPAIDRREARASLRPTLYRLTQALGDGVLDIQGDTVCLRPDAPLQTDNHLFQTHATLGLL